MTVVLAVGFLSALAAVPLLKISRHGPLVLALVPFSLTVYFLTRLGDVADGGAVSSTVEWVPALNLAFALRLDGLSLLFALLICGIGTLVTVYASSYMEGKPNLGRFYLLLYAFMASMLGVVLADNLITLFIFWELTSVTSYGLISYESERESARAAALQALLVTAGAGLALLAGFVLLGIMTGADTISGLTAGDPDLVRDHSLYLPALILVAVGAFAKSGQVPFHFWLPNAMAAPTPISAYLHSATMVKAGIYLLARLNPVMGGTDAWTLLLCLIGGLTTVTGAILALKEIDLKRILAYSTLSTLGLLVLLIGVSTPDAIFAAIIMIVGHALYKAALFMNAGIVDHETGTRDISLLGGLRRAMPVTATTTVLAAASMAGVAFTFGFLAKEYVYEAVQHARQFDLAVSLTVILASVILVAVALLLVLKPYFGEKRAPSSHVHEGGKRLLAGPVILCAVSLVIGLFPYSLDQQLLGPATAAATGEEATGKLYLWHGWTFTLLLSQLTLAMGVLVYLKMFRLNRAITRVTNAAAPISPQTLYTKGMAGMVRVAGLQTDLLQHGYLRLYVAVVILAASVLIAGTMLLTTTFDLPDTTAGVQIQELAVSIMIFAGGLLAVMARTRVLAAIALGAVGYGVALLYMLFGAPDLAMTQILVETLIVLLFVFAFYRLPRFANYTTATQRVRDMAISVFAGLTVMALMLTALSVQRESAVSTEMATLSKPEAHGSNIVNVILVDFRALDTLGEITVLMVAAVGVVGLLKLASRGDNEF